MYSVSIKSMYIRYLNMYCMTHLFQMALSRLLYLLKGGRREKPFILSSLFLSKANSPCFPLQLWPLNSCGRK